MEDPGEDSKSPGEAAKEDGEVSTTSGSAVAPGEDLEAEATSTDEAKAVEAEVTSSGMRAAAQDCEVLEEDGEDDDDDDDEEEEPSNFQVYHLRTSNVTSTPRSHRGPSSSLSQGGGGSGGGRRLLRNRSPNKSSSVSGRFAVLAGAGTSPAPSSLLRSSTEMASPLSAGARPRAPVANKVRVAAEAKPCNDPSREAAGSASASSPASSGDAMNEYWCHFHTPAQDPEGEEGNRQERMNEKALSEALEKLKTSAAELELPQNQAAKTLDKELEQAVEDPDFKGLVVGSPAAAAVSVKIGETAESQNPQRKNMSSVAEAAESGKGDSGGAPSLGPALLGRAADAPPSRTFDAAVVKVPGASVASNQQQQLQQQQQQHPPLLPLNSHNVSQQLGMYNWQSTKMTVKERLAFMFNNEILADVHFIVGRERQQQRIPAHRFVLSVGSAVFDAMFNSSLATRDDEVTLPDVEPTSFLALLRFLYSDEVQIGPETVMTTLYTAKKYAVPALEKHCVDFLKRNLSADNAFMLLTQARLFDEPQLAALCLETIDKFTPEALNAEGFIDIDIDTLSAVLDRDSLRIKEAKLFTAVIRWSEAECLRQSLPVTTDNKRSVLGHVLTKIRFPLMTIEEFAQGPAQSGILTDRECVSVFLHFTVNPKPPVGFLDVPRCSMTGKEQTVCRFQQIESRWGYSGTSDKIRFVVDRRIFAVGFGLYGSIHGPSEYQVNIQIFHTGSGRLLGSNELSFLSDGTNSTFRVMFKEPIEILPNTNYTASATLKGLDSHYGTRGMRKVWVDSATGGRVTFQFSYAAGNNNGTSVEDGQIPEIIFYT